MEFKKENNGKMLEMLLTHGVCILMYYRTLNWGGRDWGVGLQANTEIANRWAAGCGRGKGFP